MRRDIIDLVGKVNYNTYGNKMTVIRSDEIDHVDVQFENGYIKRHVRKWCFMHGNVKSPYDKRVYGIGFIGEGKYKPTDDYKVYKRWQGMLQRCYDEKLHEKHPTYKNCSCCEEWHNFQNFSKWYSENYYEVEGEVMCLDKDILVKGNKIYSPETCIYVPRRINIMFTKTDALRGNLPIGVTINKNGKYIVTMRINKRFATNKKYNTPKEAFESYKLLKESYIKEVAEEYKDKIPEKLYKALKNYEVEITD